MKIAVVGLHWGHVHINAYRQLGHEVSAVADTDFEYCRKVAEQYGIPQAYASVSELAGAGVDLVSLAVPARCHYEVLEQAMKLGCAIICEKPVLGYRASDDLYARLSDKIYFNYAYPFLKDIDVFYGHIDAFESIKSINIECLHNLQLNAELTDEELFYETVSHLIALMVHKFPDIGSARRVDRHTIRARTGSGTEVTVVCRKENSINGLRHTVKVEGSDELILSGEYVVGSNWHYAPIIFNGNPVSEEYRPEEDPWYTANKLSLGNAVRHFMNESGTEGTLRAGGFNLQKAMIVERILNCLKTQKF